MRLLLLLRQLNVGGAQRQVVELARSLDRDRFEITVITLYPGGLFAPVLEAMPHVRLVCADKRGRWDVFGFLRRLVRTLRDARPDVIHAYLTMPNILAVLLRIVVPRVKIVWGIRASNMDLSRYDRLARVTDWLQKRLARFPDLIIVNSEAGLRHHGFPPSRSIVIQNGIDVTRFRPGVDGTPRRRAWGFTEDDVVFGVVGRIDPMKDQLNFVRAAAIVAGRLPRARFVIVGPGGGAYADAVSAEVRRLGLHDIAHFTGEVEVDAETYAALDVFVSSSAREGFPNAVAEAMACGTKCVVTDVGDAAIIAGAFALVVPAEDAEALAEAMLRAVDLPIDADAAARSIAERFGTDVLARKTSEALMRLRS